MNGRGKRLVIRESCQYPVGLPGKLFLASLPFIAQKFYYCKGESVCSRTTIWLTPLPPSYPYGVLRGPSVGGSGSTSTTLPGLARQGRQYKRRDRRLAEAASSRQSGCVIGNHRLLRRQESPKTTPSHYRITSGNAPGRERCREASPERSVGGSRLPVPPVLTVFVRAHFAGSAGAGIGCVFAYE